MAAAPERPDGPLPAEGGAATDLPGGHWLEGREAVRAGWRALLCGADASHRQLTLVDDTLAEHPLDDAEVLQALARWLRLPGRRLQLLVLDADALARAHPRFGQWRLPWLHAIDCLTPDEPPAAAWPRLVLGEHEAIEWLDDHPWRARRTTQVLPLRRAVDALAQRCRPAWPSRTLGL